MISSDSPSPPVISTPLDAFERLVRNRRATRHFRPGPIDRALLDRLVEIARWAPSGYNLQPTHFVVVIDPLTREKLAAACMGQDPVREVPAVIVVTGARRVAAEHFEAVLQMDRASGATSDAYAAALRKYVPLSFSKGFLGVGWLWKATLLPIVRLFTPVPSIPAVHNSYWLAKQTMLSAMNLMLAAEAAGLSTLPMEGFDEARVRRALGIPASQVVTLVIAIGYGIAPLGEKTRLPLDRILHHDRW